MIVCSTCIPCYLKQTHNTLNQTSLSDQEISRVLIEVCKEIPNLPLDSSPAQNSSVILHRVCALTGVDDPFHQAKLESNRQAMELWGELRQIIADSNDPLLVALKIAVAGNVVDLGILAGYDLRGSLRQVLEIDFRRNDYPKFKAMLKTSRNILYIGDNSGEIAFDKLLVEKLVELGQQVTYVVKGGPVLNDATMEDARLVGMQDVARVITTGSNYLGVVFEQASAEFKAYLNSADLVISKGQANYESLEGREEPGSKTFFALKAKCEIVAKDLGVDLGDIVFANNQPEV